MGISVVEKLVYWNSHEISSFSSNLIFSKYNRLILKNHPKKPQTPYRLNKIVTLGTPLVI